MDHRPLRRRGRLPCGERSDIVWQTWSMGIEENKEIVRRFNEEAFGLGDIEAADRYLAPDTLNHVTGRRGIDDWKRIISSGPAQHAQVSIEDVIAEGDKVAVYLTLNGVHDREIWLPSGAIPATGRSFSVKHVHIYRLADGLITEHWAVRDDYGMFKQLGITE